MYLSVVIPAYDEEKRLPETLRKIRAYLKSKRFYDCHAKRGLNPAKRDWEVLIVNDGSKDLTAQVVEALIKDWPNFRLLDNKENKGKGAVVKQGMFQAKGEWRLFMDADNSTDISQLDKFWEFIKLNPKSEIRNPKQIQNPNGQKFEIIIGSRYLKKDSIKIKQPFIRRVVSRIGNWLIRILLGLDLKDTQCGFKLFSAKAAKDIFPKQTILRWGFDMEILAIAKHHGFKIKEVAVDWYDSTGSTVKKSAALKTLKELFTIKWNLVRGLYNNA